MLSTDTDVAFQTPPQSGPHLIEDDDGQIPTHRYPLRFHVACRLADTAPLQKHSCNAVLEETTGNILEYRHLIKGVDRTTWITACANDFGRLAQGIGKRMPNGTNTIFFIPVDKVTTGQKVSYIKPVAAICPNKAEVNRV